VKARRAQLLAGNPFPDPLTLGFFFREKLRAIHEVAPDGPFQRVLEIGGGRGGVTGLLYPQARVVNLEMDAAFATAPPNAGKPFVCGDATRLPFIARSFDAVTMFDVLEHVPDHAAAIAEALRVLRPQGALLVSSPNEHWRFPYYAPLRIVCPTEAEIMAEWGHVRRGYRLDELERVIGLPCLAFATFITPLTVLGHDIAFSRLPYRVRRWLCALLSPLTWLAYAVHRPSSKGTETASAWRKPAEGVVPAVKGRSE
jgi:SAM-dependent methyltransferase